MLSNDAAMWRERAEAAEAEVSMLRAAGVPARMAEACEIANAALRIVALAGMYPKESTDRALVMLRDAAVKADDEDSAAIYNIIRAVERRADPEAWHGRDGPPCGPRDPAARALGDAAKGGDAMIEYVCGDCETITAEQGLVRLRSGLVCPSCASDDLWHASASLAQSIADASLTTADAARGRLVHVPHPPVPAELAALGDAHTYSEAVCVECHPHPEHGGPCLGRDTTADAARRST